MKLPFTNLRLFERAQHSSEHNNWRESIRPNLSHEQVARVNAQIRRFARFKEGMEGLLDQSHNLQRSYDASVTTGYNADFKGTYTSANAEIISSDYQAIARARTICKDTPQGKAVLRTHANNVVGHNPFKLDMRYGVWKKTKAEATGEMTSKFVQDEEINRAIETEWEIFGQPDNFTNKRNMSRMEAFRIMEMSAFRDGFVLLRHHDDFPFTDSGYVVELLERDRLQSQFMGKSDSGNPIRFSIEFDKNWNFPVRYWVLSMHPGDAFGQSQMAGYSMSGANPGMGPGSGQQLFRVGIDAKDMTLFNNLRDRAEQDVGFTELDSTIQALWRIYQYEKALTFAAIASCMKVYWWKKNFPTGLNLDADAFNSFVQAQNEDSQRLGAGAGKDDDTVRRQQNLQPRQNAESPGSTLEVPYGMELMQTDPKFPIEASHAFRQDNLRDIAVGAGVRYQDVSGDFQNLGFAAALMCSIPAQENFKVRQRNFIDLGCRPIFKRWLKNSIMKGVFDKKYPELNISITMLDALVQASRFKGKRWPFVNPLVQAQTFIILMEAGIMSPQQVQDELEDGKSIEDLYTQIEEANNEQAKHSLYFGDADVTRPTISKGEPGEVQETPEEQTGTPPPVPKTRPGNPVRSRKKPSRISAQTLALIDQQGDGTARNGNGNH